jgi:O-antigen/teichoic acid export membrane protein
VKSSTVRDISRGSFYLGLEQVTNIIGGFLYAMMVLRMLGPATFGVLNMGQAAIGLAGVLTTNIEVYLERFVAELDARGLGRVLRPLVRKILTAKMVFGLVTGILVILLADWMANAYGQRDLRRLLPVLAPMIMLEGAYLILRFTLFGLQRYRTIWAVALGNNLLKLIVVFMLWRLNEGVVALVAGIVGVQIITVGAFVVLALRSMPESTKGADDIPSYRKIWSYVHPLYGARVFYLAGVRLNILILGALLSARDLGLVSFALMTMERFIGSARAISDALLPSLSRLRGEGQDKSIEQVINEGYRLVTALAVLLMAGTYCLAREITVITGGSDYLAAILPLQILAIVPLFRTTQQPLTMSFYTYEKTRVVFWLAALKFVVEPIAYLFLIPHFGIAGVAVANLLSSLVIFGPALLVAGKLFPDTRSLRWRGAITGWAIGAGILVAGTMIGRLPESWPALPPRVVLLVAGTAAIVVFRMVGGTDLRRFAEATERRRAGAVFRRLAGWVDWLQGRATA